MDFISILFDNLLLCLQIFSHRSQLILIIILQGINIRMPQLRNFSLQRLILDIIRFLLILKQSLQILNLQPQIITFPLILKPNILNLHIKPSNFVTPGLVQFGQF